MRKIYLLCTALMAMFAINAHADRILYSENYESGSVPSTWTINGGTGTIAGDNEGKYFSFALGSNNGRSANDLWGAAIYDEVKEGLTEYTVSIDFQIQAFGNQLNNKQCNGTIAIFSSDACELSNGAKSGTYANYTKLSPNCLFEVSQNSTLAAVTGWFINNDSTVTFDPVAGDWYNVTLNVNIATREVSYEFTSFSDAEFSYKGSKIMAEDANLYATGLYVMNARYQSVTNIDNIVVSIPGDYANKPVIAMTGLNMSERTYTISFMEGETLHFKGTDGTEKTVSYYDTGDVPGAYVYTTTTSGTIEAYTTAGTMTSEKVTAEVDCTPIVLPSPTYAIVSASEGYAKTYQFSVDNTSIPLSPEVFMDFSFKSESGAGDFTLNNQNNGVLVELTEKGTLTVTTKALGYANGTTSIVNDQSFTIKHDIDFQHKTADELFGLGFTETDALQATNVSGESNWTGRGDAMRFKWVKGTEVGDTTFVQAFGHVQAVEGGDPIYVGEGIRRFKFMQSKLDSSTAHNLFAPLYTWWPEVGNSGLSQADFDAAGTTNLKMYLNVGLCHSGVLGDDETYDPAGVGYGNIRLNNTTLGVDGLTDDDFIVVSKISNYGRGATDNVFIEAATEAEATQKYIAMNRSNVSEVYKGTETFQLFRVDTALSRVLVLTPGASGIDEIFTSDQKTISDHNAPVYNLNGVQVNAKNLKAGVYVKQGKKFIVK